MRRKRKIRPKKCRLCLVLAKIPPIQQNARTYVRKQMGGGGGAGVKSTYYFGLNETVSISQKYGSGGGGGVCYTIPWISRGHHPGSREGL